MVIDLNNWLCVIGVAVVILLACVGLITITCIIFKFMHETERQMDGPYDYYDGCDMEKVMK